MSAIPIKIMLHGLIALAPVGGPNAAHHMTALVIDGRTPPARECMGPHHPRLTFRVAAAAQCRSANCEVSGNLCACIGAAIAGKEISIEISPTPTLPGQDLGVLLSGALPANAGEAGRFRYVPNLSEAPFSVTLDSQYLADPLPARAHGKLLARMSVPFQSMTACSLARREETLGVFNVHALAFRPLGEAGSPGEKTQAMAQMVVADLEVPDAPLQKVRINLKDFAGGQDIGFDLAPDSHGYMIELANEPDELLRDSPCDDGIARHFTLFYDLAANPPAESERLIPHVQMTQWKSVMGLTPEACKHPTFSAMDRPICPMVSFN